MADVRTLKDEKRETRLFKLWRKLVKERVGEVSLIRHTIDPRSE